MEQSLRLQSLLKTTQERFQKSMLESWDAPDHDKRICKHFGCPQELTLIESIAGHYCTKHSKPQNNMQPHGIHDPILFVSY